YGDDRRIILRRAKGYSFESGKVVNASYISMSVPHAAGGLVSTVDDLLRWDIALRSGAVVRKELLDRAWSTRTLPDGTHSGYGFGWKICAFEGHRTIEHGGWINGFSSKAIRFPDDNLNVIVLVNNDSDRPDAGRIARRIAKLVLTGSDKFDEYQLNSAQRQLLLGRYILGRGGFVTISERHGSLYYQRLNDPPERLVALSPATLSFANGDRSFLFSFELGPGANAKRVRMTLSCEPVGTGARVDPGTHD
ncbi:MAG: serine hydrolase domain-containing protein, partial [Pyrinomonadaceae bacterium]